MADLKRRIIAVFSAQNKAKGVMAGFRRGLDSTGQAMKRMAKVGAVMTVAAAAGLAYMVKRQMEAIDVIAKLSDRLGMSTEALIGMQHGANIAGVESETLNKALSTLSSRLGEVDMGVGQATYALEKLGLNYKDLIGLDMDKAIGIVADQIRGLGTQAEKAAAANYLFGKSGKQLLNLFEEGSAGVAKYQEEVRKLGLSFSRIDAAQVEAANDALTRARATMTGLFRTATIELAPYIGALADKFVDVATAGEGLGANVVNVFERMSMATIKFGGLVQTIPAYWKGVEAGARDTLAVIYDLAGAATNLDVLFKKLKRPGWEKTYKELAEEQRQIAAGLLEEGGKQLAGTYGQENAVRQFYDNLRAKATGQPDFITTFPEVKRFEREPFSWEKKPQEITEEHRRAAEEIDKVWTEMWLKQEAEAYHAMRAPIIAAEKLAEESAERRKRIAEDIALSMAQSWSSAIDQMMFEGKKFWDAMEDMARSLLREITRIIIYKQFTEKIAYAFMGLPVPSAQHGGIVARTGLAVVHRGETYSGVNGGGGGRGGVTINVNNVPETYEISEAEEYMLGDERIINVFMQKIQTNGPLRRSIKQIR